MAQPVPEKRYLKTTTAMAVALIATLATPINAQETDTPTDTNVFTMLGRLVFGAGSERVAIDVPQAVSVVNQADFDREQATTVGDVLERIPGVSTVGSESPWGESFNIRGIGSGGSADEPRIVMLIDGVGKYYEQYRLGSLFTEPEFFKRVEVLRGPSSSTLYGSGAIAGVIAMETKDASDFLEGDDTFAARQRLQFTGNGNGKLSSTILAFAPNDNFEGLLGFNYRTSDVVEGGGGQQLTGTEGTSRAFIAKGTLRFGDANEHALEASVVRNTSFVNDQVYNLVDATTTWGTVDRDFEDTTAYLKYNYNPTTSDFIDLDVQLSYSNTSIDMSDPQSIFLPVTDYTYKGPTLKVENSAQWSGDGFENYLTAGFSVAQQERVATPAAGGSLTFHPAGETQTTGVWLQNEWIKNDSFTVIGGLRMDRQDLSPSAAVGSFPDTTRTAYAANLALHYQVNDQFAVFGSASYTERLPTIDEMYDTRTSGGVNYDVSVANLQSETSRNVEIGASWSTTDFILPSDDLTFKAVAFQNRMSDQIARNAAAPGVGVASFVNLDKTEIRGLEIEAAWEAERFFGSLAVSHLSGKNIGNPASANPGLENQLPADNITLSLGTRLPDQNLEFGWSMSAAKSADHSSSGSTVHTAGFATHDVYASWTPDQGVMSGTEVRFGVSNVFDRDYRTNLQSTGTRRAGRSINLTLSKTF